MCSILLHGSAQNFGHVCILVLRMADKSNVLTLAETSRNKPRGVLQTLTPEMPHWLRCPRAGKITQEETLEGSNGRPPAPRKAPALRPSPPRPPPPQGP